MLKETIETIRKQYESLPVALRNLLDSEEEGRKILGIAKKYNLNELNSAKLMAESGLVVLGLVPYEQLVDNISRNLGIGGGQAEIIFKELKIAVFSGFEYLLKNRSGGSESQTKESIEVPDQIPEKKPTVTNNDENPYIINGVRESKEEILRTIENPVPSNLPTGDLKPIEIPEKKQESTESNVPRYGTSYGKQDPYREPIE